jgi:hypothetical protein
MKVPGNLRYATSRSIRFSDIIDLGHLEHFSCSSFAVFGVTTKDTEWGASSQLPLFYQDFSREFLMIFSGFCDEQYRYI